jgi:uncharacterized protein
MDNSTSPTKRTRVVREPQRGVYDRDACYQILDDGLVCHVGFAVDNQPYVIPTMFARIGDVVYFHGSAASRMLRHLSDGAPASLTVTIVDGVVLARSIFNHSMNYRSVVVLGTPVAVTETEEKLTALHAFTEKILPGRWNDARTPTPNELSATSVLRMPLTEMSAKVREGPVEDNPDDYALRVWAGVVPLTLVAGEPIRDDRCDPSIQTPEYASHLAAGSRAKM